MGGGGRGCFYLPTHKKGSSRSRYSILSAKEPNAPFVLAKSLWMKPFFVFVFVKRAGYCAEFKFSTIFFLFVEYTECLAGNFPPSTNFAPIVDVYYV